MYADDSIFMQDCAPYHTSLSTMSYLDNKKIYLLSDWPPDMNVIENMWSILKTNVSQFNMTPSDDIWSSTLKAWNDIPIELSIICMSRSLVD